MAEHFHSRLCQRCGRGFIFTPTYHDFLARRGAKVVVPVLCPTCFIKTGPLPKERGEVKWFSQRKHYGFIVTGEGVEVFFHARQIFHGAEQPPEEGQPVRFHLHYPRKGPEALNVELLRD
jgi:CspA family cold shock protein